MDTTFVSVLSKPEIKTKLTKITGVTVLAKYSSKLSSFHWISASAIPDLSVTFFITLLLSSTSV